MAKVLSRLDILLHANTANYQREIKKATDTTKKELKSVADYGRVMAGHLGTAFATIGSAVSISHIVQTADNMQNLTSKIRLATSSADEYKAVQEQLRTISNAQKSSFEGVVDLYSSSQCALSQLGKTQQDVINFTKNMTMAMNIGGSSAQAQAAALTQLGQALGSGALRGDEFNSVAEQAPILMELIAKRMGVATAALRDLAKEGKITADVVYEAVSGSTQALEEMMSKTNFTMSQGWQVVKDNFGYLVHDIINETTGIAGAISDVLAFVGQNLKTIATIAGVAAAVIGAKMLLGSAQVKEFAASVLTKTTAMRADAAETIRNAYSLETYNQANLRLIHTKNLLSQRLAVARLAKLHYSMSIKEAWATTTGYIQSQLTLTNAKNITTAAITRATGAVVGFGRATATNIVAAAGYTRSLFTINGAKTAFIGATRAAISGVVGFGSAVKAGTVSVVAYTRAIVTSTITKRAFVGTASLASTAVGKIGTAFAAVGRIIMAHPIMIIGGIISAVIVRTMGLQKAMESLSDAVGIVGSMLGDMVDVGIDGFKWLGGVVDGFFSSFTSGGDKSTGLVSGFFGDLFAGTEGGFVGLIQVIARLLDRMVNFFGRAVTSVRQTFIDLWNGIAKGAASAFTAASSGIASVINGVLNIYDRISNKVNEMVDLANKAAATVGLDVRLGRMSGTGGLRVSGITIEAPTLTDATPWTNKNTAENYVKGLIDQNSAKKQQQAARDQAAAANAAADATNKLAKANKNGANAKGKNEKAGKDLTDQTDKAGEKLKQLAEAVSNFNKSMVEAVYDAVNVGQTQLAKLKKAIEIGELQGIDDKQKALLTQNAINADQQIRYHEGLNRIRELNRGLQQNETVFDEFYGRLSDVSDKWYAYGEAVIASQQVIEDVTDKINETTISNDGTKPVNLGSGVISIKRLDLEKIFGQDYQKVLTEAAKFESEKISKELDKSNRELENQLALMSAGSETTRVMLELDQARTLELEKYSKLKALAKQNAGTELGETLQAEYDFIQSEIEHNNQLKQKVALQTSYNNLLESQLSPLEKSKKELTDQLDIITKMSGLGMPTDGINMGSILDGALGLSKPEPTGFDKIEAEYQNRLAIIGHYNETIKANWKGTEDELARITAESTDKKLEIEKQYHTAKRDLILSDSESLFGSLASITKDGLGEQSKIYRAMFAMQQGFAIAQASIAMSQAMSKGLEKGFPAGLADMALAVSHGAKIVSAIKSVVMPVGQAHDGIMSVPKSGTWNLEKGERVLPKHTAQNLDNTLNRLQAGGGGQIINVSVTVNSDGSDVQSSHDFGKNLGNAIKLAVQTELQKERRQGGLLYGR